MDQLLNMFRLSATKFSLHSVSDQEHSQRCQGHLTLADLGIHISRGKLFRGPEVRERGWGQLGVWASAVISPSGVWGGAPAEIEFVAF